MSSIVIDSVVYSSGSPTGTNTINLTSQVSYRAWGGMKSYTYGSGQQASLDYNARMQLAKFELPGMQWGVSYGYGGTQNDGRVKRVDGIIYPGQTANTVSYRNATFG